ncbi:T9SS type A sorting domain-containing protein [Luteirhabdus pelagi]|uniref:T9SS type A sorting domain-containing protein n=1 Tax=Luteirhabdus pelagi TaxID=2792783 RepID=UPI00193A7ABC|nr:T9SS type A sorting domain-containing protein [Luteirhabdus pelagi]
MMKTFLYLLVSALLLSVDIQAQDIKIYVSDAGNFNNGPWQIVQYDLDGSNPVTFINDELGWPQDIVFLPEQNEVLISNLTTNEINRYNGSTGEYIDEFATVAGGPTRMEIGADGLLYVLQWSSTDNKVLRYETDGTFVDEFTSEGVPRSIGMDWDSEGNLYVSSFSNANVTQFDSDGNLLGEYIDNTELSGPTNIFFDDDDRLFVLDWNAGDIEEYDENGIHVDTFITGLGQCEGVDFLENGNILVGNGSTAEVKQYQNDGTFVEITVASGLGNLLQPNAVVLFDRETLSITDQKKDDTALITPTVGSRFEIHKDVWQQFDSIIIYSLTGKSILNISQGQENLDASALANGIYIVKATSGYRSVSQKIKVIHQN